MRNDTIKVGDKVWHFESNYTRLGEVTAIFPLCVEYVFGGKRYAGYRGTFPVSTFSDVFTLDETPMLLRRIDEEQERLAKLHDSVERVYTDHLWEQERCESSSSLAESSAAAATA